MAAQCCISLAVGCSSLGTFSYAAITACYHLSKRQWNTVTFDGSVPEQEVLKLVDHSYDLVLAGLTTAQRNKLIS